MDKIFHLYLSCHIAISEKVTLLPPLLQRKRRLLFTRPENVKKRLFQVFEQMTDGVIFLVRTVS